MKSNKHILPVVIVSCVTLLALPSLYADDPVASARAECSKQATDKTGYTPGASSGKNTVAKGAAIGAAGGTAARAIGGKSLLKGAAIGAAAGAAAGGLKKNQDKKQAVLDEANYNTEYDNCLKSKGLVPENIR